MRAEQKPQLMKGRYRSWLDSVGTPVGVQQKLMRHSDIRITMNVYGDAASAEMAEAHGKVVRLALAQSSNGLWNGLWFL